MNSRQLETSDPALNDVRTDAFSLVQGFLFLERLPNLSKSVDGIRRIYSVHGNSLPFCAALSRRLKSHEECLLKLLKSQPMVSYMDITFRQFISFLFEDPMDSPEERLTRLLSFINEARESFGTLCKEDRRLFKGSNIEEMNNEFQYEDIESASFLIAWSIIEAAKYCVLQRLSTGTSPSEFLSILLGKMTAPVLPGDEARHLILIEFVTNLDRLIFDRISKSSTGSHTFREPKIEKFYQNNRSIFKSWFLKNCQSIAKSSLALGDSATCWRYMNIRLFADYKTKFCFSKTNDKEPSFTEILQIIDSSNWQSNLASLCSSAQQLGDIDLLYGIESLCESRELITDKLPLKMISLNLKCQYESAFNMAHHLMENDLDELSKIEFLRSSLHLGLLKSNSSLIDKLESPSSRSLYKLYLESISPSAIQPSERLEKVKNWLSTWSEVNAQTNLLSRAQTSSIEIDLVVPACLNVIAQTSTEQNQSLLKCLNEILDHDLIARSLVQLNLCQERTRLYNLFAEMLKTQNFSLSSVDSSQCDDLFWCQDLYRLARESNLIKKLRASPKFDQIQFNALKFHRKHGNTDLAEKISIDLLVNSSSDQVKFLTASLMTRKSSPNSSDCLSMMDEVRKIKESSVLSKSSQSHLISKMLRRLLLVHHDDENHEKQLYNMINENDSDQEKNTFAHLEGVDFPVLWENLMHSWNLSNQAKTMLAIAQRFNKKLDQSPADDNLLNSTFCFDLKSLELLAKLDAAKYRSLVMECALRVLKRIYLNHDRLSSNSLKQFSSSQFIHPTWKVWIPLRRNLVAAILCQNKIIDNQWRDALIGVVKLIAKEQPNLFIYSIIVNRLDLKYDIHRLTKESEWYEPEPNLVFSQEFKSSRVHSNTMPDCSLDACNRKLAFWRDLCQYIKEHSNKVAARNSWSDTFEQTEMFVKEIRSISYLCGEYFRQLTMRIPKKLHNFLDQFSRNYDPTDREISERTRLSDEMESKLDAICNHAIDCMETLLNYKSRTRSFSATRYENWFFDTFSANIKELKYRLSVLLTAKPLMYSELEVIIGSITELFTTCRGILNDYNQTNRNKLFMELISPVLSRLQPSHIIMPDSNGNETYSSQVTIHKISQTIDWIISKTSPKKLKFVGSDGISRSFLLKAQEDLRLDESLMSFFSNINKLLLGDKRTKGKFQIRLYSVTPMSSSSGLIQWIEVPSFLSFYRSWFSGPNGKRVVDDVYRATCSSLCDSTDASEAGKKNLVKSSERSNHVNCQPPEPSTICDLFHQLLWAKIKSLATNHPMARKKPSSGNIGKYRTELDLSLFESTLEELIERVPSELITNQLMYKSLNSYSYWLKTNEFIRSCATMSIVGYVIGLGDRHPDNILLDLDTGQVIHIDYNICFELGKALNIPEKVPFRLTQNMIRAFGFAGLEGGFTKSCCQVMQTLKKSKSTLANLLDPVNLNFLIDKSVTEIDSDSRTGSNCRSPLNLKQQINLSMFDESAGSVEKIVDTLIVEATSIKNQSAMFEGWIPWL